ncbi:F-box DNA helicase 1-like [Ptychodera flava]|uniref:F-box DNA helicase 1-like n=1 Tax=Ptychodera flava TaxID=63121 RepID=UPI00396A9694
MLQRQSTIDSFFVKASPRRTQEDRVNMYTDKASHSSGKEGVGEPDQKRKKLEMSSSECLRRSSTAEGTAPLTSPLSVQKTSRDVNRGLYPRNSRKNHSSNPTLTKLKPRNRQSKLTAVTSSQFKHSGSTFATQSSQNGSETALSKTLPGQRTPTKEMVTSNATIQCKKSWSRSQPRPSSSPSSSSFQFQRSVSMPSMQASSDCGRVVSPNTLPNQSTPTKLQASPKATLLSPKSWSKSRPSASVSDQSPGSSHKGPVRSIQAEFDRVASSSPSLEKQTNQMSKAANSSTCDNDIANAERTTNQATNSQLGQTSDKDGSDPNLLAFENDAEMEELMATQIMMENEFDDESEQDAMPNTFGLLGEEMQIEEEEEKNYFEDLPPEVIENIFSQLPMIDLCLNVNRVCRQWNDIISDCKFMPWKKTYHKLKAKDSTTRHEIRQIMRTNNMDSENDSLLQIVRYMKNFTRRSNSFMVDHLKKHPKCDFAIEVIKEKVSDTLVEGDPNPWCLITMLVVLSETVKDVQQIIQCILNSSSTTLASNVIECLYCIATFLFALHGMHNLNRGIHYRVFYALYLYENVIVSTPDDRDQSVPSGSGQQSLRRYGTGVCGGIRLTHEQLRIVKYEFEKNDIMKIMAFAGTGKTSTLIDYTKRRPNKQFLYVCYNKSVQEQAEQAFPWNVTCKTIHALAFNTTGRRFVKQLVSEIKSYYVTRELPEKRSNFVRGKQVKETIDSYLASADQVITTRHTPDVYQNKNGERTFITHEQKMAIVQDSELIWEKMQDPDDWKIRMTHDGYLKMFQLMKPTLDQYHCILIDEGQDCTPAAQDILLSQDCPKILVCDPHQQIYSFKGARNAMREAPSSQVFYLTQSFRFGPQIGYIASCVLENFKRITEKTIVGNDKQDSVYGDVEGQVAVITRYNYTLFNEAVILANQETPCRIAFVGGNKYLGDLLGSILDIFTLFCKEAMAICPVLHDINIWKDKLSTSSSRNSRASAVLRIMLTIHKTLNYSTRSELLKLTMSTSLAIVRR